MSNIKVLISGPIRPNIKYVNYLIEYIKNMINQDITIFLCYWDNEKIEKSMFKYVDYILNEKEPEDEEIFSNIKNRTIQQRQLGTIEHWTPRIYKMFYGIRKLVDFIDDKCLIEKNNVVIRIRTDLYINNYNMNSFNYLLNNINENTIYNRIRKHTCDWFSISNYDIFKKIWYINNDYDYNIIINKLFNAEDIVTYKSRINNINIINIKNIINLSICREYNDSNNPIIQYYN